MLRKVPLIVILGSTGTGKTKLSIELAERFCGEIISADSMQVYTHLDIATAKATKVEQARVKHHLLDITTPDDPFTVVDFRDASLPIIENLLGQSKCPIVVGGTNYYIESLLWDILVAQNTTEDLSKTTDNTDIESKAEEAGSAEETGSAEEKAATSSEETKDDVSTEKTKNPNFLSDTEMADMKSDVLHNHLKQIDPETANRIHPNNKRKIVRAIEVYQESGETLSAKLKAQREQPGGNRLGGPLRYPHIILLWLRCKQDVLNRRLSKRIDDMLKQGLLREIRNFHNIHKIDKKQNSKNDNSSTYTRGVLQTIGFKEFIPYLEKFDETNDYQIEEYLRSNGYRMPTQEQFKAQLLNSKNLTDVQKLEEQKDDPQIVELEEKTKQEIPPGLEVLKSCLNELKCVTQRYSKKQIKWINNRFLASKDRQMPDLYELDTTDVKKWHTNVYQRALTIIESYRNNEVCEIQPMARREHPGTGLNEETTNFCDICQRTFIGEYQWNLHKTSNNHKRQLNLLKYKKN